MGNDFTVQGDALVVGNQVKFFTSDRSHYQRQGEVSKRHLASACKIIEVKPLSYERFEDEVLAAQPAAGSCGLFAKTNSLGLIL
jgi:hypothetical protein